MYQQRNDTDSMSEKFTGKSSMCDTVMPDLVTAGSSNVKKSFPADCKYTCSTEAVIRPKRRSDTVELTGNSGSSSLSSYSDGVAPP